MLAQVLGLLGHTVLKLQLLHLIVWTCEEVGVSQMAEGIAVLTSLKPGPHTQT